MKTKYIFLAAAIVAFSEMAYAIPTLRLYSGSPVLVTDNGAGGLSSSLGEMAGLSGGVKIDLDACPLKYQGLAAWEILVSESQERMSLAVPPDPSMRCGTLPAGATWKQPWSVLSPPPAMSRCGPTAGSSGSWDCAFSTKDSR